MLKHFLFLVVLFGIFSCTKEDTGVDGTNSNFIELNSVDELTNLSEAYHKGGDSKSAVLEKISYKTLSQRLDNVYKKIDEAESEEVLNEILRANSDIITLKQSANGEETVSEFGPTKLSYSFLLNEHGIIKVDNQFWKFIGNKCFISENINVLKNISSVQDGENLGLESFISFEEIKNLGLRNVYELLHKQAETNHGCSSKYRKVSYDVRLTREFLNSNQTRVKYFMQAVVYGQRKKKKFWSNDDCLIYHYKTRLNWNNFSLSFDLVIDGTNIREHFNYSSVFDRTDYSREISRFQEIKPNYSGPAASAMRVDNLHTRSDVKSKGVPQWLYVRY